MPQATAANGAALNGVQLRYLSGCPTDVSANTEDGPDGQTDLNDLRFVMAHWLSNAPGADLTGPVGTPAPGLDGIVDLLDLLAVVNAFGPCVN